MIKRCFFENTGRNDFLDLSCQENGYEASITLTEKKKGMVPDLVVCIEFEQPIISIRNVCYQWEEVSGNREHIANEHTPKILVLKDGTHVVSTRHVGLWSVSGRQNHLLRWVLKDIHLTPLFQFTKQKAYRFSSSFETEGYHLGLLFSRDEVPEFSRSPLPFTPIVCFTDHCDYDTPEDLTKQLTFFEEHGIRVTKGFFLHHFSKREDNASYEREPDLLRAFSEKGHELAYHSLSQSIRPGEKPYKEFTEFSCPADPPFPTWIDHGQQPYNFTKIDTSPDDRAHWSRKMRSKGVHHLWNYLDSGLAKKGVINQLNPRHFTLSRLLAENKLSLPFLFRTVLFYYGGEDEIKKYKSLAGRTKEMMGKKKIGRLPGVLRDFLTIQGFAFPYLFGKSKRKEPFRWARYAPYIFRHKIGDHEYHIFQTTEVTDFESAFSPENIDLLMEEKGAITVHCYFSSSVSYQEGRLFVNGEVSQINKRNFAYLGEKVRSKEVWNPTLKELMAHYRQVLDMTYYVDPADHKIKVTNTEVPVRYIRHV